MGILTNIFYLISTSLLIPVMLALLWCLVRGFLLAGKTLREYSARAAVRMDLARFSQALEEGRTRLPNLDDSGLLARTLSRLSDATEDQVIADKIVHDCQLTWQVHMEQLRSLARLGPALGLMGTLIPLGPALVGLAAGDLQMMSQNLVIAFATTVVGLLVGTLATTLAGIKKRWYQADLVLLTFAANRIPQIETIPSQHKANDVVTTSELTSDKTEVRECDGACSCNQEPSHA